MESHPKLGGMRGADGVVANVKLWGTFTIIFIIELVAFDEISLRTEWFGVKIWKPSPELKHMLNGL